MSVAQRKLVVGIVDYQAGNIRSIENAFDHLGARTVRIQHEADFASCTHALLPGVGAFGFCADRLRGSGLLDGLHRWALDERRPLLGICVGMQLMAATSEEQGYQEGLGWIGGRVSRLPNTTNSIRVPHVGWNTVRFTEAFGEFAIGSTAEFYFDHSFAYHDPQTGRSIAQCQHGIEFCAVVQRENITAAQFHPEKSQVAGMRFLRSFLAT